MHQTSLSLDVTTTTDATPAHTADVWDAVDGSASDNVLDTVGAAAWGQFYTSYVAGTSGARAQLRVAMGAIQRP